MVDIAIQSNNLTEPGAFEHSFGEFQYYLMGRSDHRDIAGVDQLSSKSTGIYHIKFRSPTVLKYKTREDTITIAIKPMQTSGLGPFACGRENLLGISAVTHQMPLWSAELAESDLYCVTVRRSLLAKHAYDIVDTEVLEQMQFLTLDHERSEQLQTKIDQLLTQTDTTQALDIRLTHLLLSVCEVASHEAETPRQSNAETLWATLRDIAPEDLSSEKLQENCDISASKLNNLFKRTTGLSARQFIANYRLNSIRIDLLQSTRTFAGCVQAYGFQSPDQLYRAYQKLFGEEPPLNH